MADPLFRVTHGDGGVLHLSGELDMASAPVLERALELLPAGGPISLDLKELTFVDSSGLHAFAQYGRLLNGRGPLVLANVPDRIADVLVLVGFDQLESIEIRR